MSRLWLQLTRLLAISVLAVISGDSVVVTFVAVTIVGLSFWVWRVRRNRPGERSWPAPASVAPPFVGRPEHGSTPQVRRALGGVEGREIVLSPWFAIGIGFCAVMVVGFAPSYEGGETWADIVQDMPFLAHPFVGMMVLVGHRSATRAERDDVGELLAACPTPARTRTLGLLSAAWIAPVVLAGFFAAYLAVVDVFVPTIDGTAGAARGLTLLAGVLLGAGGWVLGVALGRWLPNPLAPVIAIVLIGLVSPRLATGSSGEMSAVMLLSTMPGIADDAPQLTAGQAALHVAWITAITAATAALALLGSRRSPSRWLQGPERTGRPSSLPGCVDLG